MILNLRFLSLKAIIRLALGGRTFSVAIIDAGLDYLPQYLQRFMDAAEQGPSVKIGDACVSVGLLAKHIPDLLIIDRHPGVDRQRLFAFGTCC